MLDLWHRMDSLNDDLAAQMLDWKLSQASAAAFRRQILQIRAMSERNILKSNLDEVPEELSRLWPSSKHPTQSNDMGVTNNNNEVDNINQIETNSLIGSSTPSQIGQITLMSTFPKSFGSTVPNLNCDNSTANLANINHILIILIRWILEAVILSPELTVGRMCAACILHLGGNRLVPGIKGPERVYITTPPDQIPITIDNCWIQFNRTVKLNTC